MNRRRFRITILGLAVSLLCPMVSLGQITGGPTESYQNQKWYPDLLKRLNQEDRIDVADAAMIRALSSNSHVAFEESWHQVIQRHGKIKEGDIVHIYFSAEQDTVAYVLTRSGIYCHLFVYEPRRRELRRIKNNGSVVSITTEQIELYRDEERKVIYRAASEDGEWIRYFCYDKNVQTFTHFRNCRLVDKIEECQTIK